MRIWHNILVIKTFLLFLIEMHCCSSAYLQDSFKSIKRPRPSLSWVFLCFTGTYGQKYIYLYVMYINIFINGNTISIIYMIERGLDKTGKEEGHCKPDTAPERHLLCCSTISSPLTLGLQIANY